MRVGVFKGLREEDREGLCGLDGLLVGGDGL